MPLEIPDGWETVTDDNELIKKIEKKGEGWKKPATGSKVSVHYTGRLVSNSQVFDSSVERNEPFEFKLGKGQVIKGWEKGVASMKKGEKSTFRMSSSYGYGDSGSPPKIPANAELEFDIELLSWSEREDITSGKKGIMKKVITKGEGYQKPNDCAKVAVKYSLSVNGQIIEDSKDDLLRFTVGEEQVPSCFEKCVESMALHEKADFKVKPEFGYGAEGSPEKNIPGNAQLFYTIELVEMEREKDTWKMEKAEKLSFAEQKKEQGNHYFKLGKYAIACKRYDAAVSAVRYDSDFEDEDKEKVKALKTACELNIAAAKLKERKFRDAISHADKVLKDHPNHIKALYRKASALSELDDWDEARKIFQQILEMDDKNAEAKRELRKLAIKEKRQNEKDKNLFRKMFAQPINAAA